ncbi:MAG: hypothetical protein ACP5SK_03410 [Thermoprotei archaeon]|nr:hypothetical protein [TACK group archaeon]
MVLERPTATTLEDAEVMIWTAKGTHRKFMASDERLIDPSANAAKEVIEKGR